MNAQGTLTRITAALHQVRLESILIGNAAAALRGAPVTTMDFDFMFRKTPGNIRKLKRLANVLHGVILRPFYPISGLYRLVVEDEGLQLDFLSIIDGVKSFESLRSRAESVAFGRHSLVVASLDDIIRSKKAVGRPRDLAVLEILERTQREAKKQES